MVADPWPFVRSGHWYPIGDHARWEPAMFYEEGGGAGGQSPTAPVYTTNVGNVTASVWEKMGDHGPMHSIKFQKLYNDRSGKLCYGDSFHPADMGALMILIIELAGWRAERQGKYKAWQRAQAKPANGNGDKPVQTPAQAAPGPIANSDGSFSGWASGDKVPF